MGSADPRPQPVSLTFCLVPLPWTRLAIAGPHPDLWLVFLASRWPHLITVVLLDLDFWVALDSWLDLGTVSDLPQSAMQVLWDVPCWTWGPTYSLLPEGAALLLLPPDMGAPCGGGPEKAMRPSVQLVGNTEGGLVAKARFTFSPWVPKSRVGGDLLPFGASCVQGMTHVGRTSPWHQKSPLSWEMPGSQHLHPLPCQRSFALGCRTSCCPGKGAAWGDAICEQPGWRRSHLWCTLGWVCTPACCCRPIPGCLAHDLSQCHLFSTLVLEIPPALSHARFLTDKPPLHFVPMHGLKLLPPTQPQGAPGTCLSLPHHLAVGGTGGSCLKVLSLDTMCRSPDAWTKCGLPRYRNSKLLPAGIGTDTHDAFAGVSLDAHGCCPSPCSAAGLHHFAARCWGSVLALLGAYSPVCL